jgi:ElaB/YqjD/DUF883 family membrane-anchored ribosome-binding protein
MSATDKVGQSRDKLMADLKVVIRDAEELLANTGQQAGEGFKVAKEKIESSLKSAKAELANAQDLVIAKSKEAAQTADLYVKEHPWQAVGMGAALGVILGFLISRK